MPISSKPDIMGGARCIDGTRVPVKAVKAFREVGCTLNEIRAEYPTLTTKQIIEAIND